MALEPGTTQKLEWLKSYAELRPKPPKRPFWHRVLGVRNRASDSWVKYSKGDIIEVELMGSGHFRDLRRNISFHVSDPTQIRLQGNRVQ